MRAIRKYFFPLLLSLTIFLSTGISTYAMGDGILMEAVDLLVHDPN